VISITAKTIFLIIFSHYYPIYLVIDELVDNNLVKIKEKIVLITRLSKKSEQDCGINRIFMITRSYATARTEKNVAVLHSL